MKTKHWPIWIMIAYAIINILLVIGLAMLSFYTGENTIRIKDFFPLAIIISAVLLFCQYFLFHLKIEIEEKRPVPKRKITWVSILLALLMAALTFTAFIVLFFLILGEKSKGSSVSGLTMMITLFILFFGSWFFWAYFFLAKYMGNLPGKFMKKTISTLLAGSVLELIIAIPSHVIMRSRGDCCAPAFSYFGIMLGTTVLLFSFGPGILFLYLKRMKDKKLTKKAN